VTCAADVLELFELVPAAPEDTSLGAAAQALLERLHDGALTGDELVRASGVDPGRASAALMELELARRVALEDGVYRVSV
jgi:predicted Rossmann fold nucleotide-binding protein DprA/Smf involved in DNA uptake